MNKIFFLVIVSLITTSVYASSACCSLQGECCGDKKSCEKPNDQKIISEIMKLDLSSAQRDKFRAILITYKMQSGKPLSSVREKIYNRLTPEQQKELASRL